MGIDSVAIKTFNSTGSQSVCRANQADETKLIESEFITKCTTEYINGSGVSFIPGTATLGKLNGNGFFESFTLPSDVDAISEIVFQMTFTAGKLVSPSFILDLIKKIEIKLGNLVVQTILPGDIYARNLTEFANVVNTNTWQAVNGNGYYDGGDSNSFDFSLSIPFTGRSTGVDRCFLQAGAVTNGLIMKTYYNKLGEAAGLVTNDDNGDAGTSLSTGVCIFSHSITSTEKNFIAKNIVNRPVNTSQSVCLDIQPITTSSPRSITIDLSPININVSHILLTLDNGVFNSSGTPIPPPTVTVDGAPAPTPTTTGTTWTPIINDDITVTDFGGKQLGVVPGWVGTVELVIGNDRTGNIPGSCLTTNKLDLFKLASVSAKNIYIIKLANSAFSTAGIPFSRMNNKKLIINFSNGFVIKPYQNATPEYGTTKLNVTCCGTQIQSTVGGSISFSA